MQATNNPFPRLNWEPMSGYGFKAEVSTRTFGLTTRRVEATLIQVRGDFYWVAITLKTRPGQEEQLEFNQVSQPLAAAKRWARLALKRHI